MPRPKSDIVSVTFRLSPDDLAFLDAIVGHLHRLAMEGDARGEASRTGAIRYAIRDAETRLARAGKKSERKSESRIDSTDDP